MVYTLCVLRILSLSLRGQSRRCIMSKYFPEHVVISIPAYNEERDVGRVIDEIHLAMRRTFYHYTLLVFDDGSKDRTVEIARQHGAVVASHKRNAGLAQTFRDEMTECIKLKADIIVHTDADGQYPADAIPRLLERINAGYDLVLGSRFKSGRVPLPFLKRLGNRAFAVVLSQL